MKNWVVSTTLLSALLTISGCAALGMRRAVPTESKGAVKSVGVVSMLGNQFHARLMGTTIFNNEAYDADVSSWQMDMAAKKITVRLLNDKTGVTAKAIQGNYNSTKQTAMLQAAKTANVDTLLVIAPSRYDNAPQLVGGYGLLRRSFLGVTNGDCIYSLFVINAYDVASGKELGWQWGFNPWETVPCYGQETGLGWKDNFKDYSQQEKEELKNVLLLGLKKNISVGLKQLGLLGSH